MVTENESAVSVMRYGMYHTPTRTPIPHLYVLVHSLPTYYVKHSHNTLYRERGTGGIYTLSFTHNTHTHTHTHTHTRYSRRVALTGIPTRVRELRRRGVQRGATAAAGKVARAREAGEDLRYGWEGRRVGWFGKGGGKGVGHDGRWRWRWRWRGELRRHEHERLSCACDWAAGGSSVGPQSQS